LFLDEIGEISPDMQVKLLRVLDGAGYTPLGGGTVQKSDFRVIAATNTDLFEEVENKNFRADLYYRLNVVEIRIPPLRERLDDLELLIDHFIKRQCAKTGVEKPQFTEEALETLKSYHWPGNIRELENCIERAVLLSQGKEISINHLPRPIMIEPDRFCTDALSLSDGLQEMIKIALERCDGNVSRAARELNIARSTLYRKMDEFGISNPS
jgi:Nif-specific regulatory protein